MVSFCKKGSSQPFDKFRSSLAGKSRGYDPLWPDAVLSIIEKSAQLFGQSVRLATSGACANDSNFMFKYDYPPANRSGHEIRPDHKFRHC